MEVVGPFDEYDAQLQLVSAQIVDGGQFEFRYDVFGCVRRYASVRIGRRGSRATMHFPHLCSDEGESLGTDAADETLRARAAEAFAICAAAAEWMRWWEEAGGQSR